jgi:hypothetical protein
MSDPIRERFDAMKPGAPSADARARMFEGVGARVRSRRRMRVTAASIALASIAAIAISLGRPAITLDDTGAAPIASTPSPSDGLHHLAATETYALASARLVARNDATFEIRDDGFVLDEGTLGIDGSTQIEGGSCRASIDGRCEVTRFEHSLRFIVEAGAVQRRSPVATCTIVDLDEPAAPETEEATEPEPEAHAPRPRPIDPTELAQQSEAYRQALALLGHDDAAALAALRAMQSRWPRGSLAPEVDFQIVRVLVRTGRDADVRSAARTFLRRHPRSARAAEMQNLIDSEGER